MGERGQVMGLFQDAEQAAATIEALKQTSWSIERVHSPIPDHSILKALDLKKSRVGLFTCSRGIFGLFFGFAIAIFTATRWELIVSGKPIIALIPFLIVGFECAILFSILGNMIGFLSQARLPDYKGLASHDPRCTGDTFGILVTCSKDEQPAIESFFREHGGEISLLIKNQDTYAEI